MTKLAGDGQSRFPIRCLLLGAQLLRVGSTGRRGALRAVAPAPRMRAAAILGLPTPRAGRSINRPEGLVGAASFGAAAVAAGTPTLYPYQDSMRANFRLLKPVFAVTCSVLLGSSLLSGCTTATYGQTFARDEQVAHQFRFKVYVGAFSGSDTADKAAKVEIDQFMAKEKYASSTIVNRRYNVLPEFYEYTVRFTPR